MSALPVVSVSSFSLREQLGPIVFRYRDAIGAEQSLTLDAPHLFKIGDFPRRAREELGVEHVETTVFQFDGLDDPELDRFQTGLSDTGVTLSNVCIDIGDLLDIDDARRDADVVALKAWIARFAAMNATFVRINPGSPLSAYQTETPQQSLIDALAELGEYSAAVGTRLLIENHGGRSSDPAWLNSVLDSVGVGRCGLLLDLGNFDALMKPLRSTMAAKPDADDAELVSRMSEVDLSELYLGIETLASRAENVSVKIHVVTDEGALGFVDVERSFSILHAAEYDGILTVEYEGTGGDPWARTRIVADTARSTWNELTAARS